MPSLHGAIEYAVKFGSLRGVHLAANSFANALVLGRTPRFERNIGARIAP